LVEVELRLAGGDLERAAPLAPLAQRPRGFARDGERLCPWLLGALLAGEDAVHLVVGEARVAADQRAVKAHIAGALAVQLHLHRHCQPVDARNQRAARLESASGSIGSTAPGTYTLVPRRYASFSSARPGRTKALTSAMC